MSDDLGVHTFPRLSAIFGGPVTSWTAATIKEAVDRQIPEGHDLDWKSALYGSDSKGKSELAKDVASLANSSGGVLVLGVEEADSRACRCSPVSISDGETRRMREICASRLRPFLAISIRELEICPGSGFYVILVSRSPDAPHAVVQDHNSQHQLSYPVRDETQTRWLSESEVAVRYRQRYYARDELGRRLELVHSQGRQRIVPAGPTLSLAMVPVMLGDRGAGQRAITAVEKSMRSWAAKQLSMVSFVTSGSYIPGVRRVVLTNNNEYAGFSTQQHAELFFDGAGFAGLILRTHASSELTIGDQQTSAIDQVAMELSLVQLTMLLVHHAVESGAAGECEVLAELAVEPDPEEAHDPQSVPTILAQPVPAALGFGQSTRAPRSLAQYWGFAPSRVTGGLDEMASSPRAVGRVAYSLASDLVGQFAVAEPLVLLHDGRISLDQVDSRQAAAYRSWAEHHDML